MVVIAVRLLGSVVEEHRAGGLWPLGDIRRWMVSTRHDGPAVASSTVIVSALQPCRPPLRPLPQAASRGWPRSSW